MTLPRRLSLRRERRGLKMFRPRLRMKRQVEILAKVDPTNLELKQLLRVMENPKSTRRQKEVMLLALLIKHFKKTKASVRPKPGVQKSEKNGQRSLRKSVPKSS